MPSGSKIRSPRNAPNGIARAPPLVMINERGAAGRLGLISPRDDQRLEQMLNFRPRVQKTRALWRAQPLMQVAAVEVRADLRQVERNLTGRVRAVKDCENARFPRAPADFRHWKDDCGRTCDVTKKDQAGAGRDAFPKFFDQSLTRGRRKRNLVIDVSKAALDRK